MPAASEPLKVPQQVGLDIDRAAAACLTDNPYFATTIFNRQGATGSPAVIAFRDTPGDTGDTVVLATHEQVGAVYGVATRSSEWYVYVAAGLKRGAPFGPGGPGQIYRIAVRSANVGPFVEVIGAGRDLHDSSGGMWPDDQVVPLIGRSGLGDIDIDRNGSDLYAMQLDGREIYRYRMSGPALAGRIPIGSASEPWAQDARPFGLKVRGDRLYHGVVNSAASTGDPADLRAYVYETNLAGGGLRVVAEFPLDYERGNAVNDVSALWQPWTNIVDTVDPARAHGVYPQPLLADIEFTDAGHMVLGLRDRYGDMTWDDPAEGMPPGELPARPAGDILLARRQGSRWVVDPTNEYYRMDAGPGWTADGLMDEVSVGGLARVLVADVTVNTAMSPLSLGSGGALWFENATGRNNRREPLYAPSGALRFNNANGHGDVEIICGPIPPPNPGGGVPTRVPSVTPTFSSTPPPTQTATATETPTATPSATATETQTATGTSVPTATATPSRTATDAPTATATVTPSATVTAMPTSTREPEPIYLPFGWRPATCRFEARYVDVSLVLDRSTSMLRPITPGGMPKNEAAMQAASRFVALMRLDPDAAGGSDRVAIVGFNDRAWVEVLPTRDRGAIASAIDRVGRIAEHGTRLDLGLQAGTESLRVPRPASSRAVMVFLTDGLPNRVPTPVGGGLQEHTVLTAAEAAKAEGIQVFTVGVGQPHDISPWLLERAASSPSDYYYAPDTGDLLGIYERIAGSVRRCR